MSSLMFHCLSVTEQIKIVEVGASLRNDLPHRRRDDLEILVNLPVEALVIEIMVRKEGWLFICLYSPHNKHKNICCQMIDALLEKKRDVVHN